MLTNVARIRIPDFPEANAGKLREAQSVTQHAALAQYDISASAHDLYIVQVVARALAEPFTQDFDLQVILSRQLGDDGVHAGVEREWALAHQHADPVSEINGRGDIYDGFRKHTLSALLNTTQESLPALHSLGEERGAA